MSPLSQRPSKFLKRTPQYLNKKGKPLQKYIILQEFFGFSLSIKIQSSSISLEKRRIFNKAPNFNSVLLFSTEQFFFSAEVVILLRTHSYRTATSGYFRVRQKVKYSVIMSTFIKQRRYQMQIEVNPILHRHKKPARKSFILRYAATFLFSEKQIKFKSC